MEIIRFKIFCIEMYRLEHNLTAKKTIEIFKKYKVLEFIESFFDVLHTCNDRFIVQDIDDYLFARGYIN